MKRLAILFLPAVLLVNLITPTSRSANDAPRFVSLEGGFSISLPDRYKQLTRLTFRHFESKQASRSLETPRHNHSHTPPPRALLSCRRTLIYSFQPVEVD